MGESGVISDEYAAGFFDGEGSVYAATRRSGQSPVLLVCISNTDLNVLEAHRHRWGGSINPRKITKPNHRPQWQWVLSARMAAPYLRAIAPHVITKRRVVELGLQYVELMTLPMSERMDYSNCIRSGSRWRVAPRRKPEWAARVRAVHQAIRAANARGFNAKREQPADILAIAQRSQEQAA
jgi:predicted HD phosphohydrolase